MTAPPPADIPHPDALGEAQDDPLVEALVEDDAWGPEHALLPKAEAAAAAALRAAGVDPATVSVSMLFAGDEALARLNAAFRGRSAPTNVLSWPAFPLAPGAPGARPPPPPLASTSGRTPIGDVALASGVVLAEAEARKLAVDAHVAHLIAHGVLHLLGYDHENDADAAVMEGLERVALAELGIDDPHA
ncbi:rRNA maturation RNase YbeY [Rubrimonas cliftonensis]|uniref:Endoribonuclease YbeY n=1 Tax=Rubrimonas cliftonensis TaxID=89524 RepID=A0A1H4DXU3_9RHOB|nr:rRNA maturation RNase YbeY [Rubrimonas cliftonensis]SEA77426.1 probable rRNA maturation factor [Rubrimonas cliftonensis]